MHNLIDFDTDKNPIYEWLPLTDQVRGGKSTMDMEIKGDHSARFFGQLVLNSDGAGFASYRVQKTDGSFWNLKDSFAFEVISRGDGRVYKLLLKDKIANESQIDYSWQAKISTTSEFASTKITIAELKPFYRGREMQNAPEFDASKIIEIGFQINDKKVGAFEFILKSVCAL